MSNATRKQVTDALRRNSPATVDTLVKATGLPYNTVLTEVTMLEMDGKAAQHGGRYLWQGTGDRKAAKKTTKKTTKTAPARKKKVSLSKRPSSIYPIEVCSTRYKDPKTGRFTKNPNKKR